MILSTSNIIDFIIKNKFKIIVPIICIIIYVILVLLIKLFLKKYLNTKAKKRNVQVLAKAISKVIIYLLFVILLMIILALLGVDVYKMLFIFGVFIVIIIVSTYKSIHDVISGICIILTNQYDVDDTIEIEGFKGKVQEISIRVTKLINSKNEIMTINNRKITKVINYSKAPSVQCLEYDIKSTTNTNEFISVLDEKLILMKDSYKEIIEGPYVLGITKVTCDNITISVMVKTEPEKYQTVVRQINKIVIETKQKLKV